MKRIDTNPRCTAARVFPAIFILSVTVAVVGCTSEETKTKTPDTSSPPPNPPSSPTPTPDTTPPSVSLTAPAPGNVSGIVTVSANASDNVGVVGVQFQLNGANLGGEDIAAPYSISWNTTSLAPGSTYMLTAVARDAAGLSTTSSGAIVTVQTPPPPPTGLVFFDDFEYEVGREDPNATTIFTQSGGWAWAKTVQSGANGARGYLYTVGSIPGYSGTFPGRNSNRVLAMEALPATLAGQTDFYLQFGQGSGPIGQIPPNHWYQFWVYPVRSGNQMSLYTSGKFLYPNRADFYPATLSNGGYVYLVAFTKESAAPMDIDPCPGGISVGCPTFMLRSVWNTSNGLTSNITYQEGSFNPNLTNDVLIQPNVWTLVKIHVDISGTDSRVPPGQGVYEMWIRRAGSTSWIKTAEYLGGVTVINGSPINFTPAYTDGLRMLRMPTTIGGTTAERGDWYDSWTYVDDFTIAGSETALPTYQ